MSATSKLREQASLTGMVLFGPLPNTTDYYLIWLGPGAGLSLGVNPFSVSGTLTRIHHPSADGVYLTRRQARAAAAAFAAAVEETAR